MPSYEEIINKYDFVDNIIYKGSYHYDPDGWVCTLYKDLPHFRIHVGLLKSNKGERACVIDDMHHNKYYAFKRRNHTSKFIEIFDDVNTSDIEKLNKFMCLICGMDYLTIKYNMR